ncbi:MAG: glycosyltransferase family 39 protein [Deltaproteobacteria bacterium]|nr:glycosyltransferase family 39 protein [Deltaproteobacteria bacterium]MBW2659088.1 glycosyltransferase family 39 protein [Deltaproteobacteria bacterium]
MTIPAIERRSHCLKFILLLFSYFTLHILLRVLLSDSLDYDEAEQALLSQWLLPGYTEQPPLYTWIQYGLFKLFGKTVFAVSLLKNTLLFFTYLFVYLSGITLLKDSRAAILAAASLLLIPQIAWESQRDMTHTTLVVFAAAAVLWLTLRLIKNRSFLNYSLLGIFCGIGLLAKANFVLFLTVLILTLLTFPAGRKLLFSRMILISLLLTAAMNTYYFVWMFNNQEILFSTTDKFKQTNAIYPVKGIKSFFTNTFLFIAPLSVIYLLIFPGGFRRSHHHQEDFSSRFMLRYGLFFVLVFLLIIILFKISYVKDRWMQPLLFAVPLIFFSGVDTTTISEKQFKRFLQVAALAAACVYMAFTLRVISAPLSHDYSRLSYPFTSLSGEIKETGFTRGLIICKNRFLAGNMLLQFPGSRAIIPGYNFEHLPLPPGLTQAAVIWQAGRSQQLPDKLEGFLKKNYDINPQNYQIEYYQHPYKHSNVDTVKLAMLRFPLDNAGK